jgi:hypothetical protein
MADVAKPHEFFQVTLGHGGTTIVPGINEQNDFLALNEGLVQGRERLHDSL